MKLRILPLVIVLVCSVPASAQTPVKPSEGKTAEVKTAPAPSDAAAQLKQATDSLKQATDNVNQLIAQVRAKDIALAAERDAMEKVSRQLADAQQQNAMFLPVFEHNNPGSTLEEGTLRILPKAATASVAPAAVKPEGK